jgi:hypothetical protein
MPYTLAHPGFVLPLQRKWPRLFNASALVMGSITPDFDIIFRFTETRFHLFDYSFKEIFFFIVPMSMVFSLYLHHIVAPIILEKKLSFDWSRIKKTPILAMIFSSIIGVLFHLLLDDLFHPNLINTRESILSIIQIQPENIWKLDFLIQYSPSVFVTFVGFFILLWYLWRPDVKPQLIQFIEWLSFKDILFFMVSTGFFALFKILRNGWMPGYGIDLIAIALTSGFIASSFLLPLFHQYYGEKHLSKMDETQATQK